MSNFYEITKGPLADIGKNKPNYDPVLNEYFFDRSPRYFESILNFYRTGTLHFPHCLCGPGIKEELKFWGIDEKHIATCCMEFYKAHDRHVLDEQTLAQEFGKSLQNKSTAQVLSSKNTSTPRHHIITGTKTWERLKNTLWVSICEPHKCKSSKVGHGYTTPSL